jgi:hypothetical protein
MFSYEKITINFTTCHARLKLYSELERLGENVIYFDTGWL